MHYVWHQMIKNNYCAVLLRFEMEELKEVSYLKTSGMKSYHFNSICRAALDRMCITRRQSLGLDRWV